MSLNPTGDFSSETAPEFQQLSEHTCSCLRFSLPKGLLSLSHPAEKFPLTNDERLLKETFPVRR